MKFLNIPTFFAITAALTSAIVLFWVSQNVQKTEREIYNLERSIDREEEMMRVLKAEWSYLNRPDRLETLADQYLDYEIVNEESILDSVNHIPNRKSLYTPIPHVKIKHKVRNQDDINTDSFNKLIDNTLDNGGINGN